jgi:hypothetical protein
MLLLLEFVKLRKKMVLIMTALKYSLLVLYFRKDNEAKEDMCQRIFYYYSPYNTQEDARILKLSAELFHQLF